MTMARLQQIYLYYSYAVFVVLLFTAWWQHQFVLFLFSSFTLLACYGAMKHLARCAKDRYAYYDSSMAADTPTALLYGLIVLSYLLFSELLVYTERFNGWLFTIWVVLILLPSLYFEQQANFFIAQSPAVIRQPEKWSASKKLFWLLQWLAILGTAAFSFYIAFTRHTGSIWWIKVGFFTLLIGIFMYRYWRLCLGFEAA